MTSAPATSGVAAHCCEWARAGRMEPIATAGRYNGFILLTLPLPWPQDVSGMSGMAELAALASERNIQVQAVRGHAGTPPAVILYERDEGEPGFQGFIRLEPPVEPGGDVVRTALEELGRPARIGAREGIRDVLVCTNGRRDRWCSQAGMALYEDLCTSHLGEDVRVWRTNDTGSECFGPTVVILPEATAWAFADAELVKAVLSRPGEPARWLDRYRGCCGLRTEGGQLLEGVALRERGWDVLDAIRRDQADPDGSCMLSIRDGAGASATWTGVARRSSPIPVPTCGDTDRIRAIPTAERYLGGGLDGGR